MLGTRLLRSTLGMTNQTGLNLGRETSSVTSSNTTSTGISQRSVSRVEVDQVRHQFRAFFQLYVRDVLGDVLGERGVVALPASASASTNAVAPSS